MRKQAVSTFAPSGALGYRILLKTNDTFDVYSVNTLVVPQKVVQVLHLDGAHGA